MLTRGAKVNFSTVLKVTGKVLKVSFRVLEVKFMVLKLNLGCRPFYLRCFDRCLRGRQLGGRPETPKTPPL